MKNAIISPLGRFSKAIEGSVALNFSRSSGNNCDDRCSFKKDGTCYASSFESFRPPLRIHLERKEADPVFLLNLIMSPRTLRKVLSAPWVRFSAFGSVPMPETLAASPGLAGLFRRLADALRSVDPAFARVHFPVESPEKYRSYRALGFSPRLSLGKAPLREVRDRLTFRPGMPLSVTVSAPFGRSAPGWTKEAKSEAKAVARELRREYPGKRIKVCPAVLGKAKCGDCTLCANGPKAADLVIYPEHP